MKRPGLIPAELPKRTPQQSRLADAGLSVSKRPPKYMVAHRRAPKVMDMLSNAYDVLSNQLEKFKAASNLEAFTVSQASAFNKLVTSLVLLQDTEDKTVQKLAVSDLSDTELELLLEHGAVQVLGQGAGASAKSMPGGFKADFPSGPGANPSGSESHSLTPQIKAEVNTGINTKAPALSLKKA